tara:strand:- start:20 stop:154 length:135 start_codon:yes stop_codon:yes gene_type:complete
MHQPKEIRQEGSIKLKLSIEFFIGCSSHFIREELFYREPLTIFI